MEKISTGNVSFRHSTFGVIVLFIHLSSGLVFAQMEIEPGPRKIKAGPIFISPSFFLKEIFTDNVFFERAGEKSDFITLLSPGIRFLLKPLHRHNILFGYNGTYTKYLNHRSEEVTNHRLDGLLELNFWSGLSLRVWGIYKKDHESRGKSTTRKVEPFESNILASSATYGPGARTKMEAKYSFSDFNFKSAESAFRNRKENAATGSVFYKFLPKTSALLEYNFTQADYSTATDLNSSQNHFVAGASWDLSDYSTGEIKGGYVWKNFGSSARSDFAGEIFSANIEHHFTPLTSLKVQVLKMVYESNLTGSNYFIAKNTLGELTYKLSTKITGLLTASYEVDEYNEEVTLDGIPMREDTIWEASAGLRYSLKKWMKIGLDYLHKNRNSNFESFDYKENRYSLRVNLAL